MITPQIQLFLWKSSLISSVKSSLRSLKSSFLYFLFSSFHSPRLTASCAGNVSQLKWNIVSMQDICRRKWCTCHNLQADKWKCICKHCKISNKLVGGKYSIINNIIFNNATYYQCMCNNWDNFFYWFCQLSRIFYFKHTAHLHIKQGGVTKQG